MCKWSTRLLFDADAEREMAARNVQDAEDRAVRRRVRSRAGVVASVPAAKRVCRAMRPQAQLAGSADPENAEQQQLLDEMKAHLAKVRGCSSTIVTRSQLAAPRAAPLEPLRSCAAARAAARGGPTPELLHARVQGRTARLHGQLQGARAQRHVAARATHAAHRQPATAERCGHAHTCLSLQRNFGRPVEWALVKDHDWSVPQLRKLDHPVRTRGIQLLALAADALAPQHVCKLPRS